jgi:hypothetical protein
MVKKDYVMVHKHLDSEIFSICSVWVAEVEGNRKLRSKLNLLAKLLKLLSKICTMEKYLKLRLKDTESVLNVMEWEDQIHQQ